MRKCIKILALLIISGFAIPASAQGPAGYLNFAMFSYPHRANLFRDISFGNWQFG